ncbi:MAG: NAD(P)-dependent oxidoreductase [Candidatus Paceibacterota bacterium]|jgi:nucleoside-diphosphate-sugar epimerase
MKIFITGGAGYVGAMLVDQFARRTDVEKIIALDKEEETSLTLNHPNKDKIVYIKTNTAEHDWQEQVKSFSPDIVIHTAWQIRHMYNKEKTEWKWNIDGSDNVFEVAFNTPSVKKLIHFSTVSSYGAFADNRIDHFFKESEPFRKSGYLYAEEKRICEEHLEELYKKSKSNGWSGQVFVLRPAAITGPRGRYDRIRFGLQSALSGNLHGGLAYRIVTLLTSYVPVTKNWLRQYIHEDDVTDIVTLLGFNNLNGSYEVFNISPPGDVVLGEDMAKAVGKKTLPIYPWMARLAFFLFWHVTRGKIPTSPGSWRGYSYPIAVDGSKLTNQYGYHYQYLSKEAFVKNEGRYKVNL